MQASAGADAFEVSAPHAASLPACVMSFAYWSPAIRPQTHLLNVQTGKYEPVQVRRAGSGAISVRGQPVTAERWRIEGPEQPIDVWYLPNGDWVGLDSTVGGGRQLRYRLR